jgi:hypothetical protein
MIERCYHKNRPLQGCPRHHVEKVPLSTHQGQDLSLMIGSDNSSTHHTSVHQAPHDLEKRLDPLHLRLRGAIHPFLGLIIVLAAHEIRKGVSS